MKETSIAFTGDLHYGNLMNKEELVHLVKVLNDNRVDIFVLAGDLSSRGADHESMEEALSLLSEFRGKFLFTPGNHDLWTKKGDSLNILKEKLPQQAKQFGHQVLDGDPYFFKNTAIVGSVGWYDYSMRFVSPYLSAEFEKYIFKFTDKNGKEKHLRWSQITEKEYEDKTCLVSDGGKTWRRSRWQDSKYIKWSFSDTEFLNFALKRLKNDIDSVYEKVDTIIAVTHHLPFMDFVPDIPDPSWGFHRAFLGSVEIGKLLMEYDRIKHIFFGHSHRNAEIKTDGKTIKNVFLHSPPGIHILYL